jgi:hypothetical protein
MQQLILILHRSYIVIILNRFFHNIVNIRVADAGYNNKILLQKSIC